MNLTVLIGIKTRQDIDKIKSEMLFEEGFKLIRVREEPLKKIYDTDVISKTTLQWQTSY